MIIAQVIGLIGMVFGILAFQCKKSENIVKVRLMSEAIFSIHYLMLGAYTGAIMNWVGCIRNFCFNRNNKKGKNNNPYIVLFCLVFIISGSISWESSISIFPILSKVITTYAYSLTNAKKLRFLTIPSSIGWLIYNLMCHSLSGVLTEIFCLTSIAIAIYRFNLLKKGNDD